MSLFFILPCGLLLAAGPVLPAPAPRPTPGPVPVVPGVSRALAEARKARISRVSYELDFTVPARA